MSFVSLNGERLTMARVLVGNVGPWVADCDFETAPPVEPGARVTLRVGALTLLGTVDALAEGAFGEQRRVRVVAGAGGWGKPAAPVAYHNDAGVKAKLIAEDAARLVGETLGTFVPAAERVGVDYVRRDGAAASVVLEDVIGVGAGVAWYVDAAGVTHVGTRPAAGMLTAGTYEVVAYDPRERVATLTVDDVEQIGIGVAVGHPINPPQVIREYEIHVTADAVRVVAWFGPDENAPGRLAGLLGAIARRSVEPAALYGLYRYRVVSAASGDRWDLQAVRKAAGLPDLRSIALWPGVPGIHATLEYGAEVLVSFVEGHAAEPVVTHYGGPGGSNWVPTMVVIGGDDGPPAARQGDTVEVLLPPASFTGSMSGAPITGIMTFPLASTLGTITTGSGKVRIA